MVLGLLILGSPENHIEASANTIEVIGELELNATDESTNKQEATPTNPKPSDPKESVTPSTPPKDSALPPLGEQMQVLYVLTGVIVVLIVIIMYQIVREKRRNPKKMSRVIVK